MKNAKWVVVLLLLFSVTVTYFSVRGSRPIQNSYAFPKKLSALRLFAGPMSLLTPAEGLEVLELSATLFTDHAEKQRLIRLPKGTKLVVKDNGLPLFPEGTLLAKTFYYPLANSKRQLIETRVLLLKNSKWNAVTYQWNREQTEAFLITQGATVTVNLADNTVINYQIPSATACTSCHRAGDVLLPIGPKMRNLNRMVILDGKQHNQLDVLQTKGLLNNTTASPKITALPNYNDTGIPLEQRARAYMDLNCAHCHNPGGMAGNQTLKLDYAVPFGKSGIAINKLNIIYRMETKGDFHMPKLGTTVTDTAGLTLVKNYIKSLNN